MTTPPPPRDNGGADGPPVDLGKHGESGDAQAAAGASAGSGAPFDPYRFGRPEQPVPPEFAPPGYVPDPQSNPYGPPPGEPYTPPPNPYGPASAHPPSYGPPPNQGYGNQPYGQQPYGNPGYGQQPPPNYAPYQSYPGYGAPQGNNGKAITAMVLGIASIPFFFLTFFDLALIIPALVFGILGLNESRVRNGKGRSQAITGIVCLAVGAIAATIFTVYVFNQVSDCSHYATDGDSSAYHSCVDDQFGR
jgi:Domain of unknown function (DUF4190)